MGGFSQIAGLLPQAPRTTALKDYGEIQDGIAKMRQVQADAAMRQQQALAQQQEREDVARKQQAWKNSIAKAKDLDEAANLYAQESGDVETAQKVLEGLSQTKERYAKVDTEKLTQKVKRDELVTGILEGIKANSSGDANRLWSEYQAQAGELQSLGVPQFTKPDEIESYINTHKLGGTLPKQELANREIKVAELRAQTDADKGKRDAEQAAREMSYQDLSAVSNQSGYDQWRQAHPAEAKALPPNFDAGAIKTELRRAVPIEKQFEMDDKAADNVRADAQLEIARANLRLAQQKASGDSRESGALADVVVKNPALWDQLTPTERGKIAPALDKKGFEGFGKPLTGGDAKKVSDARASLGMLAEFRKYLEEHKDSLGPVSGFAAINPYSDTRAVRNEIKLKSQQIGKQLEGGVLRKEDEEKYKEILSNIADVPEFALEKLDSVARDIDRAAIEFENELRFSGKRVSPRSTESAPGVGKVLKYNPATGKVE